MNPPSIFKNILSLILHGILIKFKNNICNNKFKINIKIKIFKIKDILFKIIKKIGKIVNLFLKKKIT